ncbi:hypothetical protein BO78DRAFT_436352 [Aspergillus sclerotiicarbonarius CBS 121057]|uniref:Transferase family protein n=1 Tax=Aspergillus sclerotiicarbonarius (strain CBS 121057 / IBT 28362) TaxID=1448318 RepID=A0A319F736_ASPSB|nr:hypothetical protein BO78DRAFT_436352 [Aspergillus sclerotiicarbonarius CBS 121057]
MADHTFVEQLTPLDLPMPRAHIRVLLVFPTANPTPAITQHLQRGLDKLSKQVPWLSGRVFPTEASPAIRYTADSTLTLVDKGSITASYTTLASQGMPIEAIPPDVWPLPSTINPLSTTGDPIFTASLFRFADQGAGLCLSFHHNATDATGFSEILHLWARNVADPKFDLSSPPPQGRLSRLSQALSPDLQNISSLSSEHLFALHPEYSTLPPTIPKHFPPCTSKTFTISIHWINILKDLMHKHTPNRLTTNTILCALLWTTITRIRTHRTRTAPLTHDPSPRSRQSTLVTAINARHRIPIPIPKGKEKENENKNPYLGNTVLYALTTLPATTLSTADEDPIHSLAQICSLITKSQSPATINSRYTAEVYRLLEQNAGSVYVGWDLFNSRDLMITSWADVDLYGVDFGTGVGRPGFVRLPVVGEAEADGVGVVLPRRRDRDGDGDGGGEMLEVVVMLRGDDMRGLEGDGMWGVVVEGGGR